MTGLVSALLFGTATPASKFLLGETPPQILAGLLYLGAALGVLPAAWRSKSPRRPWQTGRRPFTLLAGAILLGGIVGPLLLLLGLRTASAGSVSLWLNLELAATVLLGHFVFHEHMTARGWIAAGGTLAAAVTLVGAEGDAGLRSGLLVAAACLCWGFDNHWTALIDNLSPAETTFWKGLVAGVFNLVCGGGLAGGIGNFGLVASALVVGALAYGLSVTLYIRAAQGLGASRSQMIFSTAPFFGVLLSVWFLGEPLSGRQIAAAVIILVALVILFSEQHRHPHRHAAASHRHDHGHDDAHHDHDHRNGSAAVRHAHWHAHQAQEHGHKHWPDLHHRHPHPDDKDERD